MPSKYIKSTSDYTHKPHSGKKAPSTGTDADLNLATMSAMFSDEEKARNFIESKRWANGVACPHCECTETYKIYPTRPEVRRSRTSPECGRDAPETHVLAKRGYFKCLTLGRAK